VRATGIMYHHRETTSTFFAMLASSLGAKQRSAIVPLSESLGPPGPQTCHSTSSRISSSDQTPILSRPTFAVFEFPDELILSVLSCVSPDPGLTGQHARFRFQYNMNASNYHQQRVAFLLPLSMTCRVMRLRLLPWIWERTEAFSGDWKGGENLVRRHKAIAGALHADPGLATNVKYFRPLICPWVWANLRLLKDTDDASSIDQVHNPFIRRMPGVPSKSTHTRDTSGGHAHYRPARESPQAH
jgi:hypothetical protein